MAASKPKAKLPEPKKRRPRRPFLPLPPNFHPLDATVDEVASFRKEGRWTVFRKVREGIYESYFDPGSRTRKIIFASVLADRDRVIAAARGPVKRKPGRPPCKPRSDQPSQAD
jgi:hypothetical protein